mgnify:FL=1
MNRVDEEGGDTDEDSAEEDPEQELLIGIQPELKRPYGWREMLTAGACILGWYSVGISAIVTNKLLLRMPRFRFPFTLCLVYMFVKWPLARLVLFAMRRPPLAFRSWGPYLWTIALTGVLTAIDVGLGLCSYLYVSVVFIVIVRASSPCWQLLWGAPRPVIPHVVQDATVCIRARSPWSIDLRGGVGGGGARAAHMLGLETPSCASPCTLPWRLLRPTHTLPRAATLRVSGTLLGLETPSCSLLLVVLLVSGGVSLAALGEVEFHLLGFVLVLTSAALAGLRSCMLQRMLHGRNTAELLSWRQSVHPVQLIYALAPWSTATALLLALFMEGEELSDGAMQHVPQLQALVVRRLGQTRRAGSGRAGPPTARGALALGHDSPWGLRTTALGPLGPAVPPWSRSEAPPKASGRIHRVWPPRCGCSA